MLLRYGLKLIAEADAVEVAIKRTLKDGKRTGDIAKPGETVLTTKQMADAVLERLRG